jgi:hypothetical protein
MQGVYVKLPTTISWNSPTYGREIKRVNRPSDACIITKVGCSYSDLEKRCASYGKESKTLYEEELLREEFSMKDVFYIEGCMIERAEAAGFKVWRTKNNPNRKEYFRIARSELDRFLKVVEAAVEDGANKLLG